MRPKSHMDIADAMSEAQEFADFFDATPEAHVLGVRLGLGAPPLAGPTNTDWSMQDTGVTGPAVVDFAQESGWFDAEVPPQKFITAIGEYQLVEPLEWHGGTATFRIEGRRLVLESLDPLPPKETGTVNRARFERVLAVAQELVADPARRLLGDWPALVLRDLVKALEPGDLDELP
jgi:hypothetical protein